MNKEKDGGREGGEGVMEGERESREGGRERCRWLEGKKGGRGLYHSFYTCMLHGSLVQ